MNVIRYNFSIPDLAVEGIEGEFILWYDLTMNMATNSSTFPNVFPQLASL